jgi:predicted nuclease of predicted toxin-antitoxin system
MQNLQADDIRLLLDENISHLIAERLVEAGIDALPVIYRDMSGAADHRIFQFAQKERRAVATINEYDFKKIAAKAASHCGVAVIPEGGSREEQYGYIIGLAAYLRLTPPAMAAIKDRIVGIDPDLGISSQMVCATQPEMPIVATAVRLKPIAS